MNTGTEIVVEQGPEWLGRLLFNPPAWAYRGVVFAMIVTAAVVVYGAYRVDVTPELLQEASFNVIVVLGVLSMGKLVTSIASWPYAVDVGVAWLGGVGLAIVIEKGSMRLSNG